MKLIGKLQNGMTFTEVKIADEVLDFKGNMGQLYYELMK